jgi:hypothetical protein
MAKPRGTQWTSEDLWAALEEFKREPTAAGLRSSSIETYVGRTTFFYAGSTATTPHEAPFAKAGVTLLLARSDSAAAESARSQAGERRAGRSRIRSSAHSLCVAVVVENPG